MKLFKKMKRNRIAKEYIHVLADIQYYKELIPELKLDVQNDASLSGNEKWEQLADINKADEYMTGMQHALIELADRLHGFRIEAKVVGGDSDE